MGVNTNMDGDTASGTNVSNLKLEEHSFQNQRIDQYCAHDGTHAVHGQPQNFPQLLASASSPSLLTGCGDPTTPTGACIEKHIHAHHVQATDAPSLCLQTSDATSQISCPTSPLPVGLNNGDPPDYLFLTPSLNRSRPQGRPFSAPPHHFERISGVLLRLIGDQYLCSTCGRQLRNIGDELTLETSLRHIASFEDLSRLSNI